MAWRKWFVRSLVLSIAAGCACALIWYQRFTNPAAVRQQVLAKFQALFPGADVSIESAQLRILGGISVNEIRLARRDDPDKAEIVRIPSAVLYHDKEKMLEGVVSLRKVELKKPRLKLTRDAEGAWNLVGLAAPADPSVPLPTMVVEQGTLAFVDKAENGTGLTLELTDVQLTMINDPVAVINIEGSALSPLTGKVQVGGQINRNTGEMKFSVRAQNVPLNAGWTERIRCPSLADKVEGLAIDAKADLKAEVAFRPGESAPFWYDARIEVRDGKLAHPRLPLALEQLEMVVRLTAGEIAVEKLKARSGAAEIEGRGLALVACPEQSWEARLEVRRLRLDDELFGRLPEKLRGLQRLFRTSGVAGIRLDAAFKNGAWTTLASGASSCVTLLPENLAASYEKFSYPLRRIAGSVKHDLLSQRTDVDVTGYAGDRPVSIRGHWQGEGDAVQCGFDIVASDVVIDEQLLAALPAAAQRRVRSFNPTGKVDVKTTIRRGDGDRAFHAEHRLRVHGANVCWDDCPYALQEVSALIDVFPEHIEVRDFQGVHKNGGKIFLQGRTVPRRDGTTGFILDISGKQLALDDDLRHALASIPGMAKAWDALRPRGRANFAATIDRSSPRLEDLDVNINIAGCSIVPTFFPFTFDQCAGKLRYFRNRLEIDRLYARRRDVEVSLVAATIDLHPGGGYYADLADLRFRKLLVDEELIQALPPALAAAARSMHIDGPLAGKTHLVVAQSAEPGSLPDIYWKCQLWFHNIAFTAGLEVTGASGTLGCRGRYNGRQLVGVVANLLLDDAVLLRQPMRNVHAGLVVQEEHPDVLLVNLKAPLHGGDITGQIRLETGSKLRYDLNLTASQIDLEQFGRHNLGANSQISGKAGARLVLSGHGGSLSSLEGGGSVNVPRGRILNLPLLLDLLKFLGLRWPDRTFFEEVHADFVVHGPRVSVTRLELLGSAISLYGKGDFNLDGTGLELDFYTSWARVEQILPPAVRPLPPAISKNLLTIEMRGKVGADPDNIKFVKKPLPLLFDPVLYMRERMAGQPTISAPPGTRRKKDSGGTKR